VSGTTVSRTGSKHGANAPPDNLESCQGCEVFGTLARTVQPKSLHRIPNTLQEQEGREKEFCLLLRNWKFGSKQRDTLGTKTMCASKSTGTATTQVSVP
jgi:hypothetical protein